MKEAVFDEYNTHQRFGEFPALAVDWSECENTEIKSVYHTRAQLQPKRGV